MIYFTGFFDKSICICEYFVELKRCIAGCNPLTKYQAAREYLFVTSQFEKDHSEDYCGTAIIIAQSRKNSEINSHLKLTTELQTKYPDFVLGTK